MVWDHETAGERARHRDRRLRDEVRHELVPYARFYGARFSAAGIDPARVRGLADLARVPPVDWDDVADDPGGFLLRPEEPAIARHGNRRLVLAVTLAKLTRRSDRVNRDVIDPVYKPVHWHVVDGVPVGYTDGDLELLAEAGSRVLALAGLTRYDVLVGVGRPGPTLAYWQLVLGARRAGVTATHLGPDASLELIALASPSVLAGGPAELLAVADRAEAAGLHLPALHTLLVMGDDPDASVRDALAAAARRLAGRDSAGRPAGGPAGGPAVVAAWAPRGARALWAECRDGPGFHTFPDLEVLEVERADGSLATEGVGELVWSSLGWRGTVFFRLRTGSHVELRDRTCPTCGRTGPMVTSPAREVAGVADRVLSSAPAVAAWQVELRRADGGDELLVFLALRDRRALVPVLQDIDRSLRATQYVVLREPEVKRRVREAGGRVVDLRGGEQVRRAAGPRRSGT